MTSSTKNVSGVGDYSTKLHGLTRLAIARRTADWLGVKMHTVSMSEEVLAEHFEDATWHGEIPIIDLNCK